jgi:hypothetical protein
MYAGYAPTTQGHKEPTTFFIVEKGGSSFTEPLLSTPIEKANASRVPALCE